MNRIGKSLAAVALLAALAVPAQISAQTLMTPGTWYSVTFSSDGMGGATTSDSFLLPGVGAFDISYQDCCIAGDVYEIYADGGLIGTSAGAPDEIVTFASAAFGGQLITLAMPVFDGGLPAGSSIQAVSVPEPGALLLVATGLLGFCIPRRRREDDLA